MVTYYSSNGNRAINRMRDFGVGAGRTIAAVQVIHFLLFPLVGQ